MYRRKALFATGLILLLVALGIGAFGIAVLSQPTPDVIRVACVGDSITEGAYPYKLRSMLGSDYTVGNFGVSGSTVSKNSTIPYMSQEDFRRAMSFRPDIVVVMLGTNDANPEIAYNADVGFEEDYKELINCFQALEGVQQIYIVKSPPILSQNSAYNNTYLVNTVFPHIDNVADQLDLPTIDMYNSLGENPELFSDGVHPNNDGASIIANTIFEVIMSQEYDATFEDGYGY